MPEIDVLIVTALKDEYEAARDAAGRGYGPHPGVSVWADGGLETPVPFRYGEYRLADGGRITVALARPTRMGGTATAPVVSSLVERLAPKCLAMCGVCAGNPAQAALGDVVVAELAYAFDDGKQTSDALVGDHRQIPLADAWVRAAQDMSPADLPSFGEVSDEEARIWLLNRLYVGEDPRNHPARTRYLPRDSWVRHIRALQADDLVRRDGVTLSLTDDGYSHVEELLYHDMDGPATLPFEIIVAPMASGNVVVKDGVTWDRLAGWGVRSVAALEMEAATIAQTAHRLEVPHWVVAKGVMDHADPRKDDRYKGFAARAAAEVLFKLLTVRLAPAEGARPASRLRSAYIVGGVTKETEYPDYEEQELADFCHRLGAVVAESGAELIICSPFADSADLCALLGYIRSGVGRGVQMHSPRHREVEVAYSELCQMLGPEFEKKVKRWHYPPPEVDDGDSLAQAWLLCQLMALDQADVVIAVGGRTSNSANTLLHLAEARRKPVVPFEFLGGASRRAYERRDWAGAYPGVDHLKLKDKNAAGEAMRIAGHLATARMRGTARGYAWPPRRVFVSRASKNAQFSHALRGYLSGIGLEVLLGDENMPPERTIESAIDDAVRRCDLFIVLWSRDYAASPYCYDEIDLALHRHRVGELQIWIVNLDGSDIVPPGARDIPQTVARTPGALVAVMRDLFEPLLHGAGE